MTARIACVTTARSDYGTFYWVLHEFQKSRIPVELVVGGSHLSERHGRTVTEIQGDGWQISVEIPFVDPADDEVGHGRSLGRALQGFSEYFAEARPDLVLLCGDRYELLAVASAAVVNRIPIAHLGGGDVTAGAADEQVRHAVTKMAHVHLATTEDGAHRIRQLGEEAWRVHVVGDPALDQFVRGDRATREDLERVLGFVPDHSTLLVTFYPETVDHEYSARHVAELRAALSEHVGSMVITVPVVDLGTDRVMRELQALERPGSVAIQSLGGSAYRGLLFLVGAMVGNSSSGLIEAPIVPLPVVNVGDRQQGRLRVANVIDVPTDRRMITAGILQALSPSFRQSLAGIPSPYGDGDAARRVVNVLSQLPDKPRLLRKAFAACAS